MKQRKRVECDGFVSLKIPFGTNKNIEIGLQLYYLPSRENKPIEFWFVSTIQLLQHLGKGFVGQLRLFQC